MEQIQPKRGADRHGQDGSGSPEDHCPVGPLLVQLALCGRRLFHHRLAVASGCCAKRLGEFLVAVGHGVPGLVDQGGDWLQEPLNALSDCVEDGEDADTSGDRERGGIYRPIQGSAPNQRSGDHG